MFSAALHFLPMPKYFGAIKGKVRLKCNRDSRETRLGAYHNGKIPIPPPSSIPFVLAENRDSVPEGYPPRLPNGSVLSPLPAQ